MYFGPLLHILTSLSPKTKSSKSYPQESNKKGKRGSPFFDSRLSLKSLGALTPHTTTQHLEGLSGIKYQIVCRWKPQGFKSQEGVASSISQFGSLSLYFTARINSEFMGLSLSTASLVICFSQISFDQICKSLCLQINAQRQKNSLQLPVLVLHPPRNTPKS